MFSKCLGGVALVALLAQPAAAQDAKTVIAAASKAIGADSLNTIQYSATGYDFAIGQAYNPSSPWPKFINKTYTRSLDFRVPASRVDRIRMQGEDPPHGGGLQPVRGEQPATQTIIVGSDTPWIQQLEIWMTPYGFLKAAATNNATLKSRTVAGKKYNVLTFKGQNKADVNGYINDQNLVEKVETWIDNPVLGDMLFDSVYTDYRDFGGVKFPMHIVQHQGDYPIFDLTVNDVKPNAAVTIQAPPARGGGAGAPAPAAGGAPAAAPSEKLADGVYLILGGYASVAVDFKDYIVVIEGPQSEERATAIITEAKRLIPNKPIKYVINTHQHFDHAGGLRTFVAEGATVVTYQINKPYYEKVWANPHTLAPDRLAQLKKKPTFETFTDKKVLTDGNHVIEIHHLQGGGGGHNEGLSVVYLPKEKILVEADSYNPAARPDIPFVLPPSPYTTNLVENLDRLKLDVDLIVPIHYAGDGRRVKLAELMKAVGRSSN